VIRPPALRPGARVALVAPAGPLAEGAVERAEERLGGWGFEPVVGRHARGRHGYLSAPDEQRAADFNAALRDDSIDALWCLRGGYGVMRILDALDWPALERRPRPVIGFSDNTALHLAIQRLGIVSFHGPHPATQTLTGFSEDGLLRALTMAEPGGILPFPADAACAETIAPGAAEGRLVGGNLALIAATLGTAYAMQPDGAILFLEEVGETVYRLDRLFSQLRLAGGITEVPDEGQEHVPAVIDLLRDLLGGLGIPVAYGFPFGHIDDNWTLPEGIRARLDADAGTLELLEAGVA
jgi:muramoyltetrapeptide carboxypeptidase